MRVCAAVLCLCARAWLGEGGLGVCCNELSSILVMHIPINLSLSATFTNKCCNVIHVDNYQQSVSQMSKIRQGSFAKKVTLSHQHHIKGQVGLIVATVAT